MKKVFRFCSVVLLIALMLSIAPVSAFAASITDLPLNQEIKMTTNMNRGYKLVLKEDSLITFSWSGHKKGAGTQIYAFSNSKLSGDIVWYASADTFDKSSGKAYACAPKGTSYLRLYDAKASTKVTFTVTPQSKVNKDNFKRAKAITLSPEKWVRAAQTQNFNYTRWYKLVLKKSKTITVDTNKGAEKYIQILDSNNKTVTVTSESKLVKTQKPVPAGTYYIIVKESTYFEYITRGFIRFRWR